MAQGFSVQAVHGNPPEKIPVVRSGRSHADWSPGKNHAGIRSSMSHHIFWIPRCARGPDTEWSSLTGTPGRYAFAMAMRLRLDPELAAAVEQARRLASEAGELTPGGGAPFETVISPEVGAAIGSLLRDGTYAAAVARVIADDPDLADQ